MPIKFYNSKDEFFKVVEQTACEIAITNLEGFYIVLYLHLLITLCFFLRFALPPLCLVRLLSLCGGSLQSKTLFIKQITQFIKPYLLEQT
jgi:hypothetical protein